jgi:hypothetical protein
MSAVATTAIAQPRVTRLTALVSGAESALISSRAEAAGQSVSAYLRDRALGEDLDALSKIDSIIEQMEGALDSANAEVAAVLARLDAKDQIKGQAA